MFNICVPLSSIEMRILWVSEKIFSSDGRGLIGVYKREESSILNKVDSPQPAVVSALSLQHTLSTVRRLQSLVTVHSLDRLLSSDSLGLSLPPTYSMIHIEMWDEMDFHQKRFNRFKNLTLKDRRKGFKRGFSIIWVLQVFEIAIELHVITTSP